MPVLAIIQLIESILSAANQIIPQIAGDIAAGKEVAGETDQAAITLKINELHNRSLELTAQLDALRDS